jgi:aldehyde dehydrogenase family 7 protein A1
MTGNKKKIKKSLTFILQGGKILIGGSVIESEGNFVQPTIVEISPNADVVKEELFAPVLYVMKFQVHSSSSSFLW